MKNFRQIIDDAPVRRERRKNSQDSTHLARLCPVLVFVNASEATCKNERISASKITYFLHGNIIPRNDSSRNRTNEKAIWEEAIELNPHVITPLHGGIGLSPIIWTTASAYELMCRTVDLGIVLYPERAITFHDSNVVPLNII